MTEASMGMNTELSVYIDDNKVGKLWLDEKRNFCFQYDSEWVEGRKIPLSLSLPIRVEPYEDDIPHAFFANLLPEEELKTALARALHVSATNDFTILEKIGGDCAGAVSVLPYGEVPPKGDGSYKRVTDAELKEKILNLPLRPLLAGEKGIRLSLAGAQKKLPVLIDEDGVAISEGNAPSSHIIKPAIERLEGSVENEAFCMNLARLVGLPVPIAFVKDIAGMRVYITERYDRIREDGKIRRLHQEDFCQVLNILPRYKYENEGGPSILSCANLIRQWSRHPARDLMFFLRWIVFNYIIGNSDAHGKNISFLFLPEGPALAPFYDVLSTRVYPGVATGLAMAIGDESDPASIRRDSWQKLAEILGIKEKLLFTTAADTAKAVLKNAKPLFIEEYKKYQCNVLYSLQELIGENAEKILKTLWTSTSVAAVKSKKRNLSQK